MKIPNANSLVRYCWLANALLLFALITAMFVYPAVFVLWHLSDPALRDSGAPRAAFWYHKKLSPKYEAWARERVLSRAAASLRTQDLVETEWPVFGSMFYLWGTEALQKSWDADKSLSSVAPKVYARGAVDAATELILDPNHAKWVHDHWGEDYLIHENVFYRGLIVSAITVHYELTGDASRLDALRAHVAELVKDIDESPAGLLEDYPGECYPGDVIMAIRAIRRADAVLGSDHSDFVARSLRGFSGPALTPEGIPPYIADARTGSPFDCARGCANSYICMNAPELWPNDAAIWYANYERHFWQESWGIQGFREYPHYRRDMDFEVGDMDAGPTFGGFGMAAAAFGLAAAKTNGRYDHAYKLATQMLAGTWTLPDGTMLVPRVLSSAVHAPYLGEACILFNLAAQPHAASPVRKGGDLPGFVWTLIGLYLLGFAIFACAGISMLRRFRKNDPAVIPFPKQQLILWGMCCIVALLAFIANQYAAALIFLLVAISLPHIRPVGKGKIGTSKGTIEKEPTAH